MTGTRRQHGDPPRLSVVIPAFNEARRLPAPLATVHAYLVAQPYTAEVIVVDDGSDDGTAEVVRAAARSWTIPLRLFRYRPNAGKGYALKYGIMHARGERVLFTDADLSTPIGATAPLLAALDAGADVAIGSRKMPGAEILVHQPWWREQLGATFTRLARLLIADVSDVTCGFKAFRGDPARDLFGRMRIADWSFDAELLLLVRRLGYRLVEVPVQWEDRSGTKVRLARDIAGALRGLARIRLNDARGVYRQPAPPMPAAEEWHSAVEPAAVLSTPTG